MSCWTAVLREVLSPVSNSSTTLQIIVVQNWFALQPSEERAWLMRLVHRVDLGSETLSVSIYLSRLPRGLQDANNPSPLDTAGLELSSGRESEPLLTLTMPTRLKRAGREMRLLIDGTGGGARTKCDRSLCRLLAQAYRFQSILLRSRGRTMTEVAAEAGVTHSHFRRVLCVSFLAPDVVQAILRDRHPVELNAQQLSKNTLLPLAWDAQRRVLGLD